MFTNLVVAGVAIAALAVPPQVVVRVGLAPSVAVATLVCGEGTWSAPEWSRPCAAGETAVLWSQGGSERFRVQLAALRDSSEATAVAARLTDGGYAAVIDREDVDGLFRVRVGAHPSREAALAFRTELRTKGFGDGFLVSESVGLVAVGFVGSRELRTTAGPLRVGPATIGFDGGLYPGLFEVRTSAGKLGIVNEVALETYLRGVVPREMGPYVYPEVEALKAQTVAARSWGMLNLGRHRDQGFDVCAAAHCQVYGGVDGGTAMSDRAIVETSGLVLLSGSRVIEAFFSATCGGHTENVENVFLGARPEPALRGVACAPELSPVQLPAARPVPAERGEDGRAVGGAALVLETVGVLHQVPRGGEWFTTPISEREALVWIETASGARLGAVEGRSGQPRLADLARWLTRGFGLGERASVLIDAADLPELAPSVDGDSDLRQQVAVLALLDAWPRAIGGRTDLQATLTRSTLIGVIYRLLDSLGRLGFEDGVVVAAGDGGVVLRGGASSSRFLFADSPIFLKESGGELVELGEGLLRPGDRIRYAVREAKLALLVRLSSTSGSDDRRARDSRWSTTLTREQLEAKLVGVGSLRELRVVSRGASGRITELKVVGERGETTLRGFAVKSTLGLKDDRVVIEPLARDSRGPIAYRFVGRGWGHGVGLCQEGAFGMALRGANFRDILGHYYTGVTIGPVTGDSSRTER